MVLIVIGSGEQRYREYLFAGAARRFPLWLLDRTPPTWQNRYLTGATVVDVGDPAAVLAAARGVDPGHIGGVLCYDEALIHTAAEVAMGLGLPGPRPEAVLACRDKTRTRALLTGAGLPQPQSIAVASEAEAVRVATELGYPVILKPRALGASQGVVRAENASEVRAAYAISRGARHPYVPVYAQGVLIEEYLDGPEISVDAAVSGERYDVLVLARKMLGAPPFFEETGHVVDPADRLLEDQRLLDMLARAHRAVGVSGIITHTEVRLTSHGPRIVEINARPGGDLIPYLGSLANGLDVGAVAAELAAGLVPALKITPGGPSTAIRFLYPPRDVTVEQVRLPEPVGGLRECLPLADPGSVLRLAPRGYADRYAALIASGADLRECQAVLDDAAAASVLEASAAPPYDPGATLSWHPAPGRDRDAEITPVAP
jgi:biotin carboxylase